MAMWFVLISAFFTNCLAGENPTVEVLNGILSGTHEVSYNGRIFSAFRGVPYASPPVGDLRFEPPQKMSNWTGVWMANQSILCLQVTNYIDRMEIVGQEDCLYLNVYVPRRTPSRTDNLDVIFDIHGGSFMLGSGVYYAGPSFLMDREVILVTVNYRLGPFGFLSTEDAVLPGNNGLKDQAFAIKWLHENIAGFGGNPNSITLTGLSAGGASVHYHYLSAASKGLFRRGFSISGNALDPWALQEAALQKAKTLAGYVDCKVKTSAELVECLRQRSALSIIESVKKFFHYNVIPFSIFGPVVEPNTPGAFLIDHPYNLLLKGEINDVPWITSFTTDDGVFPAGYFHARVPFVEENWRNISAILLDYEYTVSPNDLPVVAERIREFYFGSDRPMTFEALAKANTHRHFAVNMERSVRMQARVADSPVYAYVFGYRGQHSFSEMYSQSSVNMGVAHGDDVQYIFNTTGTDARLTEPDEQMKDVFLDLIFSYASEGIPYVGCATWKPVRSGPIIQYLDIRGPQDIQLRRAKELAPQKFWRSLPLKENENANRVRQSAFK